MNNILAKAIGNICEIKSGYVFELGKAFKKIISTCPELGVIINTPNPSGTQDYKKI